MGRNADGIVYDLISIQKLEQLVQSRTGRKEAFTRNLTAAEDLMRRLRQRYGVHYSCTPVGGQWHVLISSGNIPKAITAVSNSAACAYCIAYLEFTDLYGVDVSEW